MEQEMVPWIKPPDVMLSVTFERDTGSVFIHRDGTVSYQGVYNPAAAAKVFWEMLATMGPGPYEIKAEGNRVEWL